MKFPIFASFIIFVLVFTRAIRRQGRKQESREKSFWEKERQANATRRKPLDDLDYIRIPLESFPTDLMPSDETVAECIRILNTLSQQKIVNFTGLTNTDLKLEYGAANLDILADYDQNYTLLVRTLQKWADRLWEAGYREEALPLMEFAVETHTDISQTYYKLAEAYRDRGETSRIRALADTAQTLRSANRNVIVRTLQESYL